MKELIEKLQEAKSCKTHTGEYLISLTTDEIETILTALQQSEWVKPNEYIICAANWYDDGIKRDFRPKNMGSGFIVCGRRHHNCISTFAQIVGFPYDDKAMKLDRTEQQGFLTNKDRWVTRLEALEIAREAKQIITGDGNSKLGLFSEDLY